MIVAATVGHSFARIGLIADALAAAAVLLLAGRARRVAAAAALVLTPLLLAGALWKSSQVLHLRHHPALAAGGIVAAVALVCALAAVFRSRPQLLALSAVAALPFRFSVLSGGTGGVLLILYAVIGGGALALVVWGERSERSSVAGVLERVLAAFVVLYALQALYTPDLAKATEELCFFFVPFSLLFVLLRGVRWDAALLRRCALVVVSLALLFVAVAAVEYASRHLVFHAALNDNQRYFRVNSLFYDPNIYGRFLALTMVGAAAVLMWETRLRAVAAIAALLALLWLGLLASVSQSSFVALLAGLAVIAIVRLPRRVTAGGVVAVAAAVAVVAIAASGTLHLNLSDTNSANNTTGGRASLVKGGADLFAARPLQGYGSGSFSCEYLRRSDPAYHCGAAGPPGVTSDSHTTPITIAAEQGVIGLLAYIALLAAGILTLARGGLRSSPVRVALLAAFIGLVAHTWAYADFLEDPITWALLAVGTGLRRS